VISTWWPEGQVYNVAPLLGGRLSSKTLGARAARVWSNDLSTGPQSSAVTTSTVLLPVAVLRKPVRGLVSESLRASFLASSFLPPLFCLLGRGCFAGADGCQVRLVHRLALEQTGGVVAEALVP
jgi:hypothetical protein